MLTVFYLILCDSDMNLMTHKPKWTQKLAPICDSHFWIRNWSRILVSLLILLFLSFVFHLLGRPVHRLTESDFRFDVKISIWWPWRHFTQKSAATWLVNTTRLSGAYAAV